jgi:hypothetical protein
MAVSAASMAVPRVVRPVCPAGSRMASDELEITSRSISSNTLTVSRRIQAVHGATEK